MVKIIVTLTAFFGTSLLNAIVPYDHIHLTATNAEEAVAWYTKHFGGVAGAFNRGDADRVQYPTDRVFYDDISIIFFEREPTGSSVVKDAFGNDANRPPPRTPHRPCANSEATRT